ncbi:peptide-methionine (S)-S-oxide reductase MsrA [Luteococcus sanguinis]|uniref:Peptide methionine sulfoxide reductase MsrA n=1 Tax=Luteococcus sanguinis TaxID=174038 RepID=A0ABW1X1G1_9ACTN
MFERFRVDPSTLPPLPGRQEPVLQMPFFHRIFGDPIDREIPGTEVAHLALGCFWGAEKLYWNTDGVRLTGVGYQGGTTPNPTYEEACSGRTGHAETVRVVFDPSAVSYEDLLRVFFENHDPTQGNRQGNDIGTQYRSAIFTMGDEQQAAAERVRDQYQRAFTEAGFGQITTQIVPAPDWYWAEDYHQQYLEANPNGYCPIHATGVTCG